MVSSGLTCDALITIDRTKIGQQTRFPSGTRSLLIRFQPTWQHDHVDLGAVISTQSGGDIIPGEIDVPVNLEFWADEAELYVTQGESFSLWYSHEIGKGQIVGIPDAAQDGYPYSPE